VRILLLHSYHQELIWTNEINKAFKQVIQAELPLAELYVEYMDTKRFVGPDYLNRLKQVYAYKYAHLNCSLVVTSDDNAFRFALQNRDVFFPDAPLVFCGINSLEIYQESDIYAPLLQNLTGVVEAYDVEETLQIALQLHPRAETIYVINDRTVTGQSNKKLIIQAQRRLSKRFPFTFLENLSMTDLLTKVSTISSDNIILLMSYNRDSTGKAFSYRQSIDLIANRAHAPMYGVWGFYLNRGIVGGMLTSGRSQGETAAHLVLRIMNGEQASAIPFVTQSPNRYMFDYHQLQRFGIDEQRLPPGSLITNQPVTLLRKYRSTITTIVVLVVAQSAVILVLMLSIVRRRRAESALKESKERYRRIFNNIQDAYYEAAFNGRVLEVSPSIEKVLGYTREEFTGKSLYDIYVNPADRQTLLDVIQDHTRVPDYELELKNKNDLPVRCAINAVLVRDLEGRPVKIVGSMRNIEVRKQDEAEKRRLWERLHRAEKMEAIGTVAGGVAHDLNNILSSLVTYPELLLIDLEEGTAMHKAMLTIQQSGQKAAAIVQDLLTLTRRGVVVKEIVVLNEIIKDYMVSPEFEKLKAFHPGGRFEVDLDEALFPLIGSPVHIAKTVMNLVSNAAEAIENEGVVTITTCNQYINTPIKGYDKVEEGEYLTLSVSDNGAGIDPEDLDKIFEPFYTKKKMGRSGTGLGMAVVWGTVKDHHGYIDVVSNANQGTTITLYLPAARSIPEEKPQKIPLEQLQGSEHILIVDDVPEQREFAKLMLQKLGYRLDAVPSGEAAIEFIRQHRVDIIVLDMIMDPSMDGLDTYRRILDIRPGQKAVIASGYAETERVKEALRLGADAFVRKPYAIEALGCAVRTALDKEGDGKPH